MTLEVKGVVNGGLDVQKLMPSPPEIYMNAIWEHSVSTCAVEGEKAWVI